MNNKKFLYTKDKITADTLQKIGYQQIQSNNGVYVFLNTEKIQFQNNNIDTTKIKYSNILTF